MGYRPQRQLVKLDFSETELAGLEVTTSRISIDGLLEFYRLIDRAEQLDPKTLKPEDVELVDDLLTRWARVLHSWNVEDDDGQPVPATREGLGTQDIEFVLPVIVSWAAAVSTAPPPLNGASPSGGSSPEVSLDLAAASQSQPSS